MRMGDKCSCKEKVTSSVTKYTDFDPALCKELRKIVSTLLAPGKGLLACDESPGSLDSRFEKLGIENTEDRRRDYRQMMFSSEQSQLSQYISGAILHHETVYQKTPEGVDLTELLRQRNVVPGIKVDKGLVPLFPSKVEETTQGLDDLQERCIRYKQDGCHFAKWRCTYTISETTPSRLAMVANANVLARYAIICQSARIVPIIEPEILTVGEHGIDKAQAVHEEVLSILFRVLNEHHVYLEGSILKPAMVLSGAKNTANCTPQIVADYTLKTLQRTVPPAVPGVLFLSGGLPDIESVTYLNAINTFEGKKPWTLSFCYGRALQNTAMEVWKGQADNVNKAQAMLLDRARLCSDAALGKSELAGGSCMQRNSK